MGRDCGEMDVYWEIAAQRIKARARGSGQLMFHQSGFVPEALTTLAHVSISSVTTF
jgi:hypothetical protein